eukprot:scaffold117970_cov22-Tisochrysis_lutea.AAC.1
MFEHVRAAKSCAHVSADLLSWLGQTYIPGPLVTVFVQGCVAALPPQKIPQKGAAQYPKSCADRNLAQAAKSTYGEAFGLFPLVGKHKALRGAPEHACRLPFTLTSELRPVVPTSAAHACTEMLMIACMQGRRCQACRETGTRMCVCA